MQTHLFWTFDPTFIRKPLAITIPILSIVHKHAYWRARKRKCFSDESKNSPLVRNFGRSHGIDPGPGIPRFTAVSAPSSNVFNRCTKNTIKIFNSPTTKSGRCVHLQLNNFLKFFEQSPHINDHHDECDGFNFFGNRCDVGSLRSRWGRRVRFAYCETMDLFFYGKSGKFYFCQNFVKKLREPGNLTKDRPICGAS